MDQGIYEGPLSSSYQLSWLRLVWQGLPILDHERSITAGGQDMREWHAKVIYVLDGNSAGRRHPTHLGHSVP